MAAGAVFEDVGQWKRPRYFPRDGESMDAAVLRECAAARTGVAVMDATTLGKIDLQGPDVGVFLDRIYTNTFSNLPVGSCRYGVMCRLDGMVFDDGVSSRIAPDRFHMTTTTGNAAAVMDHLEEYLQTEWPDLRVRATSVTEQWVTIAVVGPRSRDVVAALAPGLDVSAEAFPFMTWRDATLAGTPGRVFRISFSGELAYELNVPSWHGLALWEAVMAAGEPLGITPYGTEALHVLRAEKGYPIIGQETDGTVTPQDLGLGWAVSSRKDFIGRRSHRRADTSRADRRQLVALLPVDPDALLPEGAQLVAADADLERRPVPMLGFVTSSLPERRARPDVRARAGGKRPVAAWRDGPRAARGPRDRRGHRRRRACSIPENARRDGDPDEAARDGRPAVAPATFTPSPGSLAARSPLAGAALPPGVAEVPFLVQLDLRARPRGHRPHRAARGTDRGAAADRRQHVHDVRGWHAPCRLAGTRRMARDRRRRHRRRPRGGPAVDARLGGCGRRRLGQPDDAVDRRPRRARAARARLRDRPPPARRSGRGVPPRPTSRARTSSSWRSVTSPPYWVLVRPSFAGYLATWLLDAAGADAPSG